eukprot:15741072-Heterocapsa_arctica.AAC.1
MAAHVVRAFLSAAKCHRVTAAVLFVDLWSGFYTVVRQLVMRTETDEDEQRQIIESLDIPRCCEDALSALMAE